MPNWCTTNYAVTGKETELKKFTDIVNSLPSRENVKENDFGKYWLGNLVHHLGGDIKKVSCRGVLNPDFEAQSSLFGPTIDESPCQLVVEPTPDKTSFMVLFSTQTAWDRSISFEELLKEKFPSMEFSFKTTDEFGNFRIIHNPQGLIKQDKFYVYIPDEIELSTNDESELITKVANALGPDVVGEKVSLEELEKLFWEYIEKNDLYGEFEVWEEE